MANDKHRTARAARERFNAELFDKWLKANGYTGKDAPDLPEGTYLVTPSGVVIPEPQPMPTPGDVISGTVTGRLTSRRKGEGKDEAPPREKRRYPQRFEPHSITHRYGRVIYSDGSAVTLTDSFWELAEARFTEAELAEHKVPGDDVCCCFGSDAGNDCGILHGSCQEKATFNLVHDLFENSSATLYPTCTECAAAFVGRRGTPLILDFLDHPPMIETFAYLLKLKKEQEE